MKRIRHALFMALALFVTGAPDRLVAEETKDRPLTTVTLLPQWTPQSQFAGYYMALEKGFYRQRGLDVRILRGGPDREPLAWLAGGKTDFITSFLTSALAGRGKGIPVVHLAQVINRSNLMLVAWHGQGIHDIKDLQGRKIQLWEDTKLGFLLFFKAHNIKPQILPQYYSVNLFLNHGVDACASMYYNEYHRIYQAGINPDEITCFSLHDYAYGFPEDGIYCLKTTLAAKPEVCKALMEASLEGWQYAQQHQEETLDIVMKHVRDAHVPTNRVHMKWMLEKILGSIFPGPKDTWRVGELAPEQYSRTATVMRGLGFIPQAVSYEEFRGKEGARVR